MAETYEIGGQSVPSSPAASLQHLAQLWAKKYVSDLASEPIAAGHMPDITACLTRAGRLQTAEKLQAALRYASAQAWSETETLLAVQVQRHGIDTAAIDPWQIAADIRYLFERTLSTYAHLHVSPYGIAIPIEEDGKRVTCEGSTEIPSPARLSVEISKDVGLVRQRHTSTDPRVLGFASMQFHFSGQLLLDLLSPVERVLVGAYFKVIDDHLYMPLQRAYDAAAELEYNDPRLQAVRQLLPHLTDIARHICQQTIERYPHYECYSGALADARVRTSTVRDVEMFQVYLGLCLLENSIAAAQEELFPLCVMLYPPLQVRWSLIRDMLVMLGQAFETYLGSQHYGALQPYLHSLQGMFAADVLPD